MHNNISQILHNSVNVVEQLQEDLEEVLRQVNTPVNPPVIKMGKPEATVNLSFNTENETLFISLEYSPTLFDSIVRDLVQKLIADEDIMYHLAENGEHYYSGRYSSIQKNWIKGIDGQTADLLDYPEFAEAWDNAEAYIDANRQAREGI